MESDRRHSLEVDVIEIDGSKDAVSFKEVISKCGDRKIQTVVLLVAMEAEALPMVKSLNLEKDNPSRIAPPAPCISYSGSDWGLKIHLVCFGKCEFTGMDTVGTAPASLYSYLAIQEFSPDIVLSVGTAGGFKSRGASIADIFIATETVNHDRRIPIPGFDTYGVGKCYTVPAPIMREALGFKSGVVSSGNSLDYTEEDMKIMTEHRTAVKEMEAAAVSWSASMFKCPVLCIKSVTDIVDGDKPAQEEFLENLHKAADALESAVPKALKFMAGKKLSDL